VGTDVYYYNLINFTIWIKKLQLESHPLIVDLDGTLINTDLLHESVISLIKLKPWIVLIFPFWLFHGLAYFKSRIAKLITIRCSILPYNNEFLNYLKFQKGLGRQIILCTASNILLARAVSDYLGVFDNVFASDDLINLKGNEKVKLLVEIYGYKGFDYAGNSSVDKIIWKNCRYSIVVNGSKSLNKFATNILSVEKIFPKKKIGFKGWSKVLRLHQWVKNVLIFIPAIASHTITDIIILKSTCLAFLSFSFCASFVYIINDILDLDNDRRHKRKFLRPFASGMVPIWNGIFLSIILLILSLFIESFASNRFYYCILIYLILTTLYSLLLKEMVIIDVITLAILYSLRVVVGAFAIGSSLSFWILAFCVFLFLSLAFVKRAAELESHEVNHIQINGRGYIKHDLQLIQHLGISSGFLSILVLALYINSDKVIRLYSFPEIIWSAIPLFMWWLSWMWLQVSRGKMHDDPVVFAIKDKTSLLIGALFLCVFVAAK